jgi:hypothetical protein
MRRSADPLLFVSALATTATRHIWWDSVFPDVAKKVLSLISWCCCSIIGRVCGTV